MTAGTTGIAFVGAGVVTSGPHAEAVARCHAASLIGVYDVDLAKARALAAARDAHAYSSLEELLADDAVDAVVVAAPTAHQPEVALACLGACKHVLVEKPVADTIEQIDAMEARARERGVRLVPAHNYVYQPTLAKAREAIRAGRLGRLASTWVIYNVFLSEQDAARYRGIVRQIGWHLAYSLLFLVGRPRRVSATATRLRDAARYDQAMLVCELPDGSLANLWASFVGGDPTMDPWSVYYKVLGTDGGFAWSWNELLWDDARGPGWGLAAYMDAFAEQLDHFVRSVLARSEEPLSTMRDARDVLRILEAAERSLADGGRAQEIDYA